MTDLDLEGLVTFGLGLGEEVAVVAVGQMIVEAAGIGAYAPLLPAEEPPQRQSEGLGVEIPQGLVDGFGEAVGKYPAVAAAGAQDAIDEDGGYLALEPRHGLVLEDAGQFAL